jgi:hypothetical protein
MTEPLHTGGMIALVPSNDSLVNLVVPGGDPVTELHLTLAYLGDDVTDWDADTVAALQNIVHCLTNWSYDVAQGQAQAAADGVPWAPPDLSSAYFGPAQRGPIECAIFAHAVFNPNATEDGAGPDEPATVYLIDGSGGRMQLEELQQIVCYKAKDALGSIEFPQQHTPFVPHVTAGYNLPITALSYAGPVTFDRVRVVIGDTVTDYPMVAPEEAPDMTSSIVADANPGDLSPEAVDAAVTDGVPVTFPVLAVEGLATSDHRYIEPGALSHRALPIPVLAQVTNGGQGGHSGAAVVGKIAEMTRVPGPDVVDKETGQPFPENTFVWSGKGELHPDAEATDLARRGYLTGNSIDLSDMDAEYVMEDVNELGEGTESLVVHGGKIAATTLVPIPAFAQAYVVLDGQELSPATDNVALAASAWRSSEVGDEGCLLCELLASGEEFDDDGYAVKEAPNADKRASALKKGQALPPAKGKPAGNARYPIENAGDLTKAIRAVGRGKGDHDAIRKYIIGVARKLGLSKMIPDNWGSDGSVKATTAAGVPEFPALSDFANPKLSEPTALTVDDDGRVFGHLATWGTCHIGFAGQCVTPPRNHSDYAYFGTGSVRARDEAGELRSVAVGHITLGTGHASTSLAAAPAAAHYDNTGTVAADIAVGDDAHGIWFSGRLRPDADAAQVRAHALSGDWRPVSGRLELVAALAVNVPGFPVPRARVASGEVMALVAAGAVQQVHPNTKGATKNDDVGTQIGASVIEYLRQAGIQLPQTDEETEGGDAAGTGALSDEDRRNAALRDLALAALPFG